MFVSDRSVFTMFVCYLEDGKSLKPVLVLTFISCGFELALCVLIHTAACHETDAFIHCALNERPPYNSLCNILTFWMFPFGHILSRLLIVWCQSVTGVFVGDSVCVCVCTHTGVHALAVTNWL